MVWGQLLGGGWPDTGWWVAKNSAVDVCVLVGGRSSTGWRAAKYFMSGGQILVGGWHGLGVAVRYSASE